MKKKKEKLNVKDREIVIPGDILARGLNYLPSGRSIRDGDKIIATSLGLVNLKGRVIKVIPLAGNYSPKERDAVIGKVTDMSSNNWKIDIRSPFDTRLFLADATSSYIDTKKTPLKEVFDIGDYVFATIREISNKTFIKLSTKYKPYRKLRGGIIIAISPTKIPRIIGKKGSMIRILKEMSGCNIIVGQNGWVWIKGRAEEQAKLSKTIKFIERKSHTSGLTDKVKKMLKEDK